MHRHAKKRRRCECGKAHLPRTVCRMLFLLLAVAGSIGLVRHLVLRVLFDAEKNHH
jgi:hypothetical protein